MERGKYPKAGSGISEGVLNAYINAAEYTYIKPFNYIAKGADGLSIAETILKAYHAGLKVPAGKIPVNINLKDLEDAQQD